MDTRHLALLFAVGACGRQEPAPIARDPGMLPVVVASAAPPASAPAAASTAEPPAPVPPPPARVVHVDVPGDSPASMVPNLDGAAQHIVFLPGVCSNAYAYLLAFPEAARAHGGIVAIDGDRPCGEAGSGFHSFSWDPGRQNARIQAALAALGETEPPQGGYTLVGYSAGAGIGQLMVQRWPERYSRVVLIGAPSDPQPALLARARGVVTMSCSRDVPGRMRDGARHISAMGVPATYVEMPGCTHGNISDGERVFGEVFDWLAVNAKE